ncbi:protein kinase [Micromonospora sp. NPDC049891]|uniref:serine/threonine-protein kinase n=1 Tax=Micromonospora sp. NPDC049891 TaxID=3155655 RepID=UPI0033CEBEEE
MLTQGGVLSGRYRLGERVATGGMGAVWRAADLLLGREVAVKVLLPALTAEPEFTTRFRAEARMLAALRHPGVVAVHDVGQATLADGGQVDYLVMEYVEGEPLSARLRRLGRLDPATTMSVVAQTAEALHAAHLAGIVHRDVKPGNLLVKADGQVVLVDFGIARSGATAGITAAHTVLGTASFMSPEQAGGQPISGLSDIYALGAVAYLCLAGRPPFVGDNPLDVALRRLREEPPPLPPDVPPPVAALVFRAMARQPGDRHASAADLAAAARATAPEHAPHPGPSGIAVPPPAAHPGPGGLAVPAPVGAGSGTGAVTVASAPTRPGGGRRFGAPAVVTAVAGVVIVAAAGVALAVVSQPDAEGADPPVAASTPGAAGLATAGATGAQGTGERSASRSPTASVPATKGTSSPSPGRDDAGAVTPQPTRSASPSPRPSATPGSGDQANPYTATQACGSGYRVINSAPLTADGRRQATVHLLYHAGTGSNCVVTLKESSVGAQTAVSAFLEVRGRGRSTDDGSFRYYAGPVRAEAAGTCVKWGGSAGGASYSSPFEHCD